MVVAEYKNTKLLKQIKVTFSCLSFLIVRLELIPPKKHPSAIAPVTKYNMTIPLADEMNEMGANKVAPTANGRSVD